MTQRCLCPELQGKVCSAPASMVGRKHALNGQSPLLPEIYITFFKPGGSIFFLLALLSFPLPIKAVRRFKKHDTPESMMPAMAATGKANTIFGLLLALGVYISGLLGGL